MPGVVKEVDLKIRALNDTAHGVAEAKKTVLQGLREMELEDRQSGSKSLERLIRGGGVAAMATLAAEGVGEFAKVANEHLQKFYEGAESGTAAFTATIAESIQGIPIVGTFATATRSVMGLLGSWETGLEEWKGVSQDVAEQNLLNADNYLAKQQAMKDSTDHFNESLKKVKETVKEMAMDDRQLRLHDVDKEVDGSVAKERADLEKTKREGASPRERKEAEDRLRQIDQETKKLKELKRAKVAREFEGEDLSRSEAIRAADERDKAESVDREAIFHEAMKDLDADAAADRLRVMGREFEAEQLLRARHHEAELEKSRDDEAKAIAKIEQRSQRSGLFSADDQAEEDRIHADAAAERAKMQDANAGQDKAASAANDRELAQKAKEKAEQTRRIADEKVVADQKIRDLNADAVRAEAEGGNAAVQLASKKLDIETKYADKAAEINKILADRKDLTAAQKSQLDQDKVTLAGAKARELAGLDNPQAGQQTSAFSGSGELKAGDTGRRDAFAAGVHQNEITAQSQRQRQIDLAAKAAELLQDIVNKFGKSAGGPGGYEPANLGGYA